MDCYERREIENYVLARKLSDLQYGYELRFLAQVIQNHDHLREKLMETSGKDRYEKYHAMVPYLSFHARPLHEYELPTRGSAGLTLG